MKKPNKNDADIKLKVQRGTKALLKKIKSYPTPTKRKPTKRVVKGWLMIDVQKDYPRICYASAKGTERHKQGYGAVFFRKPPKNLIGEPWKKRKLIIPCEITYLAPKQHGK